MISEVDKLFCSLQKALVGVPLEFGIYACEKRKKNRFSIADAIKSGYIANSAKRAGYGPVREVYRKGLRVSAPGECGEVLTVGSLICRTPDILVKRVRSVPECDFARGCSGAQDRREVPRSPNQQRVSGSPRGVISAPGVRRLADRSKSWSRVTPPIHLPFLSGDLWSTFDLRRSGAA